MEQDYSSRIRKIRDSKGLNIASFSRTLEIPRSTLVGWEEGKAVAISVLPKLHERFGVNVDWFLTGEGEMFVRESDNAETKPPSVVDAIEDLIEKKIAKVEKFESLETRLKRLEDVILAQYSPNDGDDSSCEISEDEPEYGPLMEIPFVDSIAAGPPIEQRDFPGEKIRVPATLIKSDISKYYAARVIGGSMSEAGIPDGSIVLIRHTDIPRENRIQLVRRARVSTLKRVCRDGDGNWELRYEDGTNRIIKVDSDKFHVQGDFVAVLPENSLVK